MTVDRFWPVVRLSEIAGKPQYGWTSSARPDAPGLPLLRTTDITGGPIHWPDVPRCVTAPPNPGRFLLKPNDIVVSRAGSVGVSALISNPPDAVFASYLMRLRPTELVSPKYLSLFLRSPSYWRQISEMTNGIALPNINGTKLANVTMLLPPAEEQRRIVDILEDHLSRLDAADAYIARAAARPLGLLESFLARDRSLHAAVRLSLEDLLAEPLRHGRSVPTSEEGFPVLRLTAIRNGRVDLNARKVGDWAAAEATPFLVERGDFLVARGNGSLRLVGRGGLVTSEPDQVAYPDTAIRVRVRQDRIDSYFLALVWDSREVRAQIERRARTTAGIFKINQADMRSITVPVPSLAAQDELVDRAMTLVGNSNRLTAQLSDARSRSTSLRRALLWAAFSGQLTGHASDLERIEEAVG